MAPFAVETMSRRELRKCYNRYCWAVILLLPCCLLSAAGLMLACQVFLPRLQSDPVWGAALMSTVNAIASYVPTALVFLLVLRRLPSSEKLPVDRLGLWEFLQAGAFALGVGFLFNVLTLQLIDLLEHYVGIQAVNRIDTYDQMIPLWDQVLFSVVVAPVCEELLFRRLLLDKLRALGDVSAVYLSALAFALFHANLYQMLYAFALGVFFAMLVLLTGSIRDTILLHMLINGMTTLSYAASAEWFVVLHNLLYLLCAILAVVLYVTRRRHFHLEPGPLPLSSRDKRRACFGSVWFYVMLIINVFGSVTSIFLKNLI